MEIDLLGSYNIDWPVLLPGVFGLSLFLEVVGCTHREKGVETKLKPLQSISGMCKLLWAKKKNICPNGSFYIILTS